MWKWPFTANHWYLGYGLHYRLWERPTVAYTGHAAISNHFKANRKDKSLFTGLQITCCYTVISCYLVII